VSQSESQNQGQSPWRILWIVLGAGAVVGGVLLLSNTLGVDCEQIDLNLYECTTRTGVKETIVSFSGSPPPWQMADFAVRASTGGLFTLVGLVMLVFQLRPK
jgi:hypothetical protein